MPQSFSSKDEAIALLYDGGQAPVISDHREGEAAQRLIQAALEHNIPIYENPDLMNELSRLNINDFIPPELYQLIAEILAFAFYIQGKAPQGYNPEKSAPPSPLKD